MLQIDCKQVQAEHRLYSAGRKASYSFTSTSTPAGRSSRMSSSIVCAVSSLMSSKRWCVRVSKCSRESLLTCGERRTQYMRRLQPQQHAQVTSKYDVLCRMIMIAKVPGWQEDRTGSFCARLVCCVHNLRQTALSAPNPQLLSVCQTRCCTCYLATQRSSKHSATYKPTQQKNYG